MTYQNTATLVSGAVTNFTTSTTVNSVGIKGDSVLNVTSGTLRTNGDFFQTQAAVNVYGEGEVLVGAQYQFGEASDAIEGGVLNVYGTGSLRTTNISSSIRIGYNAEYYNVEAKFYGNSSTAIPRFLAELKSALKQRALMLLRQSMFTAIPS